MHAAAVEPRLSILIDSLSHALDFDTFSDAHDRGRMMSLDAVLDQVSIDLRKVRVFVGN
jgi:hypothetical protein